MVGAHHEQRTETMSKKQRIKNRILWNERGGEIDEVVFTRPEQVHIEQMSDGCWWIGVHLEDGTYWAGNFLARSKTRLTFTEQESDVKWDHEGAHDDQFTTKQSLEEGSDDEG